MTYAQAIVVVLVQLAPSLVVLIFVFIVLSWIRVLVDKMSGKGL